MKILFWIFIAMFWYGVLVGPLGASMLALVAAFLIFWADRRFKAQDKAWAADPRNARKLRPTQDVLDEAGVECSSPSDRR